MKILRVQKNKILFENGAEFSLPKNTIREYNLKESMEITGESYMLLAESSALSFSYWLLAKRDYSTMELETKLLTKYKEKTIISKVIQRLNDMCYLNDYEFAKSFIESHKTWGKKKIEYQLALKGIKGSAVRELLNENTDSEICEIQKHDPPTFPHIGCYCPGGASGAVRLGLLLAKGDCHAWLRRIP